MLMDAVIPDGQYRRIFVKSSFLIRVRNPLQAFLHSFALIVYSSHMLVNDLIFTGPNYDHPPACAGSAYNIVFRLLSFNYNLGAYTFPCKFTSVLQVRGLRFHRPELSADSTNRQYCISIAIKYDSSCH
jgi:hypothetical protein